MKKYTFSEMNRLSGEILENALVAPVALTKYGKDRLVILTAERYHQLLSQPQTAFTIESAPDDVHAELLQGLDAILNDGQ